MMFKDIFYNRLATITGLLLLALLVYILMPVLIPFIVAFVLAYLLNPLVVWLGKIGVSRWLAICVVFILVGTILGTAISFLIPLLIDQFELAKNNMPVFLDWLNHTARPWVSKHIRYDIEPFNTAEISNEILSYLQTNYNVKDASSIISKIATSGLSAISSLGLYVLIPVILFFFMASWDKNISGLKAIIPPRLFQKTMSLAQECHDVVMSFVKGQMLVMMILGLVYALGLQFLAGLETGFMIGFMAGLASLIPYFGIVVGVLSAVVACIVQFGFDLEVLALIAVVFAVGQGLEGYVLQPILLGDRIGLSPVMVIFVVLVGGNLLGLIGMLIALPVAAVIMVLVRHAYEAYRQSEFYLSDNGLQQNLNQAALASHASSVGNNNHAESPNDATSTTNQNSKDAWLASQQQQVEQSYQPTTVAQLKNPVHNTQQSKQPKQGKHDAPVWFSKVPQSGDASHTAQAGDEVQEKPRQRKPNNRKPKRRYKNKQAHEPAQK